MKNIWTIFFALFVFTGLVYADINTDNNQPGSIECILDTGSGNAHFQTQPWVPRSWHDVAVSGRRGNVLYDATGMESDNKLILDSAFAVVAQGGSEVVMPLMFDLQAVVLNPTPNLETTQHPATDTQRPPCATYTDMPWSSPLRCIHAWVR